MEVTTIDIKFCFNKILWAIAYIMLGGIFILGADHLIPSRKLSPHEPIPSYLPFALISIGFIIKYTRHKRLVRITYSATPEGIIAEFRFSQYIFLTNRVQCLVKDIQYLYGEEKERKNSTAVITRIYAKNTQIYKSSGTETIDGWSADAIVEVLNKFADNGATEKLLT